MKYDFQKPFPQYNLIIFENKNHCLINADIQDNNNDSIKFLIGL